MRNPNPTVVDPIEQPPSEYIPPPASNNNNNEQHVPKLSLRKLKGAFRKLSSPPSPSGQNDEELNDEFVMLELDTDLDEGPAGITSSLYYLNIMIIKLDV